MGDKGDSSKKQKQHISSSSPKGIAEEQAQGITESTRAIHHPASPFISSPLYVSTGASSSPFEQQQQQFETLSTKRPRYSSSTGQWKLLPSPPSQQQKQQSSSPSTNPQQQQQQQMQSYAAAAASSSDTTASSPSHSPMPLLSGGSGGQEGNKPETEQQAVHQQLRKGKYVSPVWKPNEMLWLARAWKAQYQGGGDGSSSRTEQQQGGGGGELGMSRGKTRADKDREVAEFLQRHGVNRDAKTAGTKWDNMLGEFRKVYEWERGGEREHIGKSYFRLSPYERKLHRLPASFDEEVFEELSQFMGSRMRSSHGRAAASTFVAAAAAGDEVRTPHAVPTIRALPPPPTRPFKEDDLPLSARTKQLAMTSGGGGEGFFHGPRGGFLGLETLLEIQGPSSLASSSSSSKELRRIGKIRMSWEESVSLWGEEGEQHRGRVKVQGSSFMNADELTFFDEAMVPCPMESFEHGPFKGFSVDRFISGQQVKVFGRRKSSSPSSGFTERVQFPSKSPSIRSITTTTTLDFRDPTDYYLECLQRVSSSSSSSSQSVPTLFELKHHLLEPPPQDLRFPLRKEVYDDLPQGKELFFTTTHEPLDSRSIMYDIVGPIIRNNPSLTISTSTTRDSFIGLWDDCINRIVSKFCPDELVLIRKPTTSLDYSTSSDSTVMLQDQWPNVTGFVNNFCLWRGEEIDQMRESQPVDPSSSIGGKLLWTYMDLPYILGYYAVGTKVTLCALSRTQEQGATTTITRTDLHELNLSSPSERIKALVPCFRIGTVLALLSKICTTINTIQKGFITYSDFERRVEDNGNGVVITEMTPTTCTRFFSENRKWLAVKEVYEILNHRIPHAEFLLKSNENDMSLVFKPRGCRMKPSNCEELVEALKYVTKALVALHDLSFMHRDLGWEKVMRRSDRENEWFVSGFDEAAGAPELNRRHVGAREMHAPEMERGLHGVKVDVWGVGYLIRTCGCAVVPKKLRELERMCMEQNPEHRPTAADCYHHLLQLQSSLSPAAGTSAPAASASAAPSGLLM